MQDTIQTTITAIDGYADEVVTAMSMALEVARIMENVVQVNADGESAVLHLADGATVTVTLVAVEHGDSWLEVLGWAAIRATANGEVVREDSGTINAERDVETATSIIARVASPTGDHCERPERAA